MNDSHKQGAWSYSASDFCFTVDDVRHEFASYIDWVHSQGICDWSASS